MGGDLVPPKPTYDADGSGRVPCARSSVATLKETCELPTARQYRVVFDDAHRSDLCGIYGELPSAGLEANCPTRGLFSYIDLNFLLEGPVLWIHYETAPLWY